MITKENNITSNIDNIDSQKHNEISAIEDCKSIRYQKMYICFMLYSVFGWLYEVFLEVVVYHWGFTNRGVLFGPYCPVYGFGAIAFVLVLYKYKKKSDSPHIFQHKLMNQIVKIITIFLCSMLIATLLELATSYILEAITGSWPWQTYTEYSINFQGRIALSPSIRFGIGGILFLYVMQPLFDKLLDNLNEKKIRAISTLLIVIFVLDFVYVISMKLLH